MIDQLISRVFAIRDCAHMAHWNAESGYHHEQLGNFYEEVIPLLDRIVEAHIGNFNEVPKVKFSLPGDDILKCLEEDVVWMDKNSETITGDVEAMENILQEITELYLSTIFKLRRLK